MVSVIAIAAPPLLRDPLMSATALEAFSLICIAWVLADGVKDAHLQTGKDMPVAVVCIGRLEIVKLPTPDPLVEHTIWNQRKTIFPSWVY